MTAQHHIVDRLDLALMAIASDESRAIEIRLSPADEQALQTYYEGNAAKITLARPLKYKDVPVTSDISDSRISVRTKSGALAEPVKI